MQQEATLDDFRAELEVFSGPLDLLLHLVKQQEVDIFEVPVATITDHYLDIVRRMEFYDINRAAEFLVVAATLMEIKSRTLLPPGESEAEEDDDAGVELVRRLLQYKQFREAADDLGRRFDARSRMHGRPHLKLPSEPDEDDDELALLGEVAVWDLSAAFGRLMEQTRLPRAPRVVRNEVPVSFYIDEVLELLIANDGPVELMDLFGTDMSRERIVGVFLALLEMIRRRAVRVERIEAASGRNLRVTLEDNSVSLDADVDGEVEADN